MSKHSDKTNEEYKSLTWIIKCATGLLVFAFIASIVLLFLETKFFQTNSGYDLSKIGAWGDAVGGILNPILSFLALIGLLWTIRLQSKELSYTRKEIENSTAELKGSREANERLVKAADQQNIETAFFQLFNLLQENLQTIKIDAPAMGLSTTPNSGAKAFEHFAVQIFNSISNRISENPKREVVMHHLDRRENGWKQILEKYPNELEAKKAVLFEAYEDVYKKHQADLGRYYRLLYNVLRFLDDKENDLPKNMYETYYKIVRASLSNYELFLIFSNSLTKVGLPMKKYISEFQLFDNLPREYFLVNMHNSDYHLIGELDFSELGNEFEKSSFGGNNFFLSE